MDATDTDEYVDGVLDAVVAHIEDIDRELLGEHPEIGTLCWIGSDSDGFFD